MKRLTKKVVMKLLRILPAFTILVGTMAVNACPKNWYQPEEPEGFDEFIKNGRGAKTK